MTQTVARLCGLTLRQEQITQQTNTWGYMTRQTCFTVVILHQFLSHCEDLWHFDHSPSSKISRFLLVCVDLSHIPALAVPHHMRTHSQTQWRLLNQQPQGSVGTGKISFLPLGSVGNARLLHYSIWLTEVTRKTGVWSQRPETRAPHLASAALHTSLTGEPCWGSLGCTVSKLM